jgi:hypothetical protein
MNEDEIYCKQRWERAYEYGSLGGGAMVQFGPHALPTWQAARAFTEAREESIRQVEEEIEAVNEQVAAASSWIVACGDENPEGQKCAVAYVARWERVLAREQAALAELKRGFRGV